jgi:hypothetical protein
MGAWTGSREQRPQNTTTIFAERSKLCVWMDCVWVVVDVVGGEGFPEAGGRTLGTSLACLRVGKRVG